MLSIRSPWTAVRLPHHVRAARLALAAASSALVAAALAGPAQAALTAVGPVNPATGFPDWYQDGSGPNGTGLKLQPCLDGPPYCLTARADLAPPDGEAFYAQAETTVPAGRGAARLVIAQEAAYLDNDPIAFGRIRITVVGATPNTTYSFAHPYGDATVTTDGLGNGRFNTDVGCGAAPCDWRAALATGIGPSFLRWAPGGTPPPAGHIGDAITPHTVTGGSVRNTFGVVGGASTDLFTVAGKLAGPPVPVVNAPGAVDFGTTPAATPVTRTIKVTSFGVPDAGGASNVVFGPLGFSGPQAAAFALIGNDCSGRALPSGTTCQLTVQLNPAATGAYSAALDFTTNAGATHIALNGAVGGSSAQAVAAASGGGLAVRSLRTTHRLSRARVLRRGLRLTMHIPQGTEIVKVSVLRVRHGKVLRKPVWLGYRVAPSRAGLYRLRLDSRALRRRLKAGLYQVNVTPGVSKRQLGATATTRIRITRG
jgi:hypothetical protein